MATASTASADPKVHKVFVCKYVGTPGEDERLQTGNNPISVDTNALEKKGFTAEYPTTSQFPFWFEDAHGRSVAIAWDPEQGDGQQYEPTVDDCPAPDNPPGDKNVPIPAAPKVKDPCGPHNIAFEVPDDTDELDWTLLGNGNLQVKPKPGYKFDGGAQDKTFELPADSNKPCDEDDDEDEIEVVADVDFRDPTCEDKTVGYSTSVKLDRGGPVPAGLVEFAVTGGALEPGSFVEVTARITDDDYEFDNEDTEEKFTHTFKDVPTDCETPSTPPATTPPATTPPPAVVPPVVGGTETAAPEPQPQPEPGEVAGTETSKPKPNKPKGEKPAVVLGTEAAVPTAVDAGLGSLSGAAPAQGSLLGQLLTGAGVALMLAAGWLMTTGRRRAGAREA